MVVEKAFAKINLVLNVLSRYPDGFHEVDFVMSNLNLHDDVVLSRSDVDEFVVLGYDLKMEDNLCYAAWCYMRDEFGLSGCLRVVITKRIMVCAGMAGGSSDCAAVIRGVNDLFGLGLSLEEMALVGARFGSDVPFCVYQRPMRAQGRGDVLTAVEFGFSNYYVVVVNPGVELSTKKVYESHVISEHGDVDKFLLVDCFDDFTKWMSNDLGVTAMRLEPKVVDLIDFVSGFCDAKPLVSGSGPTVLYFFDVVEDARRVYDCVSKEYEMCILTEMR